MGIKGPGAPWGANRYCVLHYCSSLGAGLSRFAECHALFPFCRLFSLISIKKGKNAKKSPNQANKCSVFVPNCQFRSIDEEPSCCCDEYAHQLGTAQSLLPHPKTYPESLLRKEEPKHQYCAETLSRKVFREVKICWREKERKVQVSACFQQKTRQVLCTSDGFRLTCFSENALDLNELFCPWFNNVSLKST